MNVRVCEGRPLDVKPIRCVHLLASTSSMFKLKCVTMRDKNAYNQAPPGHTEIRRIDYSSFIMIVSTLLA